MKTFIFISMLTVISVLPSVQTYPIGDCRVGHNPCIRYKEVCYGTLCYCLGGNQCDETRTHSAERLKPYSLRSVKSHNSITLSWTSDSIGGYSNKHVVKYRVRGAERSQTVSGRRSSTVIRNLSPGTTYTFTVHRYITRNSFTESVPKSDPYKVTTKGIYFDSCTGGSSQCGSGLVCVSRSSGKKCLCRSRNYFTGSVCTTINRLKPTSVSWDSQTHNSVNLSWTSPDAAGYTNSYVINYRTQGGSTKRTPTITSQDQFTTVRNLSPGTTYIFTVVRSIARYGRTQTVPSSATVQATTNGLYSDRCSAVGGSSECGSGLVCVSRSSGKRCLCKNRNYFTGSFCTSITRLKPTSVSWNSQTHNSVNLSWTSPDADNYTNSYVINYRTQGGSTKRTPTITSQDQFTTVRNLSPGTTYIFTVVRSIARYGRTQTVPSSATVQATTNPAQTSGLAPDTSLAEPTAEIHFYKAEGRADSYNITLKGDDFNMDRAVSGSKDILSASFPGVSAGLYYNLTIITNGFRLSSDPFTQIIRIQTEASEAVVDLSVVDVTSRSASLSWRRPVNTKGVLYMYTVEVSNTSTCAQRINIQCTACTQAMNVTEVFGNSCERRTDTIISQSDLNNVTFLVQYDLSLLPATAYDVVVAAYNEEGKGQTDKQTLVTEEEAPRNPKDFRFVSKTSESVELTWKPREPRPGKTSYIITVYEWDEDKKQYSGFQNISNQGEVYIFRFEMYARARKGVSDSVDGPEVITDESAPTPVENLELQPVDGVNNKYQLSWRCPPQKDGRNGVIRSATVITSIFSLLDDVNPTVEEHNFDNSNCTWKEQITMTPEFNYTFEVFISNSQKGKSTTIQQFMPAGTPSFVTSEQQIITILRGTETGKSVELLICPTCLLDNTNGVVVKSGILVCAKGDCPLRNFDEVKTEEDFDKSPNWDATTGVGFSTWYRATEDGWLKGKEASDEIRFVLGEESCGVQDQSRFCNGPLPVDRTYRVWLFACTRVSCSEGNHVEFTLDNSLSLPIIGAIVGGAVLFLLASVLLVVYMKVIRPRSQRQGSTQDTPDTSLQKDIYEEVGIENGLFVIQDVRPEVECTEDSQPHSENTYDHLAVYSNTEQNVYERIETTQA